MEAELPEKQSPSVIYEYDPKAPVTGKHFEREWVDLGLPSGVRWARGVFDNSKVSWGKTTGYDIEFCIANYKLYGQDLGDIAGNDKYDFPSLVMGRGWRIPRVADIMELMEYCDREYTTENGRTGVKFTSRINGESIFMPSSGYKEGWNECYKEECYFWLATPGPDNYTAHIFKYSQDNTGTIILGQRHIGCLIYPVMDRPIEVKKIVKGNVGGHDWIDLGLPSGTRWATCNVGASKPSQPGMHYAWGETVTKSSYTAANSKHYEDRDAKDIAGTADDVAHVKWGNGWKMPTCAQMEELNHYCYYEVMDLDGRCVIKAISKLNGEYIILPTTGMKEGTSLNNANGIAYYWGSTPNIHNGACGLTQNNVLMGGMGGGERYYGYAVRPVLDKAEHLVVPASGSHNGHDWVDLGLPSGTKWATCNVGAEHPDLDGEYFAWGEITTVYEIRARKNNLIAIGVPGIAANPRCDVATARWGNGWQMPSKEQCDELIEHCTWEWTTLYGRIGYKVISKSNGNWIFLTSSGVVNDNHSLPIEVEKRGGYWSSTPCSYDTSSHALEFTHRNSAVWTHSSSFRLHGRSVRPVLSAK